MVDWVRRQPLCATIVLIRLAKKHRKSLTYTGIKRQSRRDKIQLKRASEPWLLVTSLSLRDRTPKQIVRIYKTRMQIEEGFRDCKSVHYGLCLSQHRRMNRQRRSVLCLIAACAIFILWCIGVAGTQTAIARQVRVNSSSKQTSYSTIISGTPVTRPISFSTIEQSYPECFKSYKHLHGVDIMQIIFVGISQGQSPLIHAFIQLLLDSLLQPNVAFFLFHGK